MKKLVTILVFFSVFSFAALASHITGGEMYYSFSGLSNGKHSYRVTLKLFQRCNSNRQFPDPAIISVFDKTTNARVFDLMAAISSTDNIQISNPDPCITNPPFVCYDVAYYSFTVTVPSSRLGYVISSQVNFRIAGINNVEPGSGNIGATYTAEIPGTADAVNGPENNSAHFSGNDLVVVCAKNDFQYSFSAVDPDNDQLYYYFCDAYASTGGGGTPSPPDPPPFPQVPYYIPEFSGSSPLGNNVSINSASGLITGIAPSPGIYVVTVCVDEVRNGKVIARQRKDIQINVADCSIASASLLPEYLLCKNTQTITIANQSNSPLIMTTDWEFIDNTGTIVFTSSSPVVTYTFPGIGVYTVKLIINKNGTCTDSTSSLVRVFPGFVPDFSFAGICFNKPTVFTDGTASVYGTANFWKWDFGEPATGLAVSSMQHPVYTYPQMGIKNVSLIVADTRGCRDTIVKSLSIVDKPDIGLGFHDTLICKNDNLMLQGSASGIYSWTPPVNIINANTSTPTVSPTSTTTYYVDFEDNGCKNRDSVKVNVVDHVSLFPMNDTTICSGDTIQLRLNSDGLQYTWIPAVQIIDATVKSPFVITNVPTNYQVTAIIGGCSVSDGIFVNAVPYPLANAGQDFSVCYNTSGQLAGSTDGSSWTWSPATYLNNPLLLNPLAYPPGTSSFVLTAFDTRGCPKPGTDTVTIFMLPKLTVSTDTDTAVVINQPVQLIATGAMSYTWSPPDFLSATNIADPVAIFPNSAEQVRYKVIGFGEEGCRDSAYVSIKVFKTGPSVFVPTAFTPNNDGLNDLLIPVAAGISHIEYFSIYNRWGQLVFSTSMAGKGWDGRVNGQMQTSNTFIWVVKAVDYTGKPYFRKGMVTLIR